MVLELAVTPCVQCYGDHLLPVASDFSITYIVSSNSHKEANIFCVYQNVELVV